MRRPTELQRLCTRHEAIAWALEQFAKKTACLEQEFEQNQQKIRKEIAKESRDAAPHADHQR